MVTSESESQDEIQGQTVSKIHPLEQVSHSTLNCMKWKDSSVQSEKHYQWSGVA